MLAVFCLRLAAGMLACLLILPAAQVRPGFYRTHLLTALGLVCLAGWGAWSGPGLALALIATGAALAFLGSLIWSVEGAPFGKGAIVLVVGALVAALVVLEQLANLVGDAASALLLGSAMTAMLIGHSYLIAPTMSLTPLLRLLAALAVGLLVRAVADGWGLWQWTGGRSLRSLDNEALLLLPVRWLLGIVIPLGLTWMGWQTARIRSTQSATGILYVVVIFVFLGELFSLLLRDRGLCL